ncbi:hypothetical protein FSP39_017727 [Pinctada imbricata]|uniref:Flavodoxin-like fold domain-containing protein n=1 Tax=Pinctada imbricata TaxID=66713 RepID=A0AA88XX36_PINIB|nr:hypothetical protein FSP39_017727 [Pinctada imbricata]
MELEFISISLFSSGSRPRRVLIVFAHPDKRSFNGALLQTAIHSLESKGCQVEVSDLHQQNFDPRDNISDVKLDTDNDVAFNYSIESGKAYRSGKLSEERNAEIDKVKRADLVVFQFPLYWSAAPAILKGWMDKVLIDGFAADFEKGKILDKGLMKDKTAVLSITTGGSRATLSSFGLFGDINVLLWPLQYGTLRMCGFNVLRPQLSCETLFVSEDKRKEYLASWESRLCSIFDEEPLSFPSVNEFDTKETWTLTEESREKYSKSGTIPSVVHHMGTLDVGQTFEIKKTGD